MSRQLKFYACLVFVLAVLFYLFFQTCKHDPALSQVNPFAEDPYDSVGSSAIQFTMLTALLALIHAFRPYQSDKQLNSQKLLLLRTEYFSCLSVAATLIADIVAMMRHPALWIGLPTGQLLATLVGGMVLLTTFVIWLIYHSSRGIDSPSARHKWTWALIVSTVDILVLALYPESWRQSIAGELLTIFVGMLFLFILVWVIGMALAPFISTSFEDIIDDFIAIHRWLKAHASYAVVLFNTVEKMRDVFFVHLVLGWVNPRRHTWKAILLIGIFVGAMLALVEIIGEGGGLYPTSQVVVVAAIFISVEGINILLGYALFAKPLGLFRQDQVEIDTI